MIPHHLWSTLLVTLFSLFLPYPSSQRMRHGIHPLDQGKIRNQSVPNKPTKLQPLRNIPTFVKYILTQNLKSSSSSFLFHQPSEIVSHTLDSCLGSGSSHSIPFIPSNQRFSWIRMFQSTSIYQPSLPIIRWMVAKSCTSWKRRWIHLYPMIQ